MMKQKELNIVGKSKAQNILRDYYSHIRTNLESILDDNNLLLAISKKSYGHSNGFSKIVLHEDEVSGIKIRLHVWTDRVDDCDESDLHDHRWSFVSIPLFGHFNERRYTERPVDNGAQKKYKHLCFTRGNSEWLDVKGEKWVSLKLRQNLSRPAKHQYYCKYGVIHSFQPTNFPAASLIVTFDTSRQYARVYKNSPETTSSIKIPAPNYNIEILKDKIYFVLSNL